MVFDVANAYPNLSAELKTRSVAPRVTVKAALVATRHSQPPPATAPAALRRQPSESHLVKPARQEAPKSLCASIPALPLPEPKARRRQLPMPVSDDAKQQLAKARSQLLKSPLIESESDNNNNNNSLQQASLTASASTPTLPRRISSSPAEPSVLERSLLNNTSLRASASMHELLPIASKPRARFARRQLTPNGAPLPRVSQRWQPPKVGFGLELPLDKEAVDETPENTGFFLTEVAIPGAYVPVTEQLALASYQLYARNDLTAAVATLQSVLRLAATLDDLPLQALVHHHLGTAKKEMGHFAASIASQLECIRLASLAGHAKLQGRGLKGLGVAYVSTEQYSRAYECHTKCLLLASSECDLDLEGRAHANLGNVCSAQGQMDQAIDCHLKDLALMIELDSHAGQARAHHNLALVYEKINHPTKQKQHEKMRKALGPMPFVHDMLIHAYDVVGNIYLQMESDATPIAKRIGDTLRSLARPS
ncbi:hypothetical protein SPRG_01729 [Saprolegnia parasitica CBS 223.65]|uniref:MalT-like TPR region domain-containing protein n=1 Tax=Saprolegnia parasitica (strain CBS 223.65) TaxID=695850 RepID=A0A067CX70_SAPPC|nr:hypothetical protein SPRG_01729 [Saprolegnia parasitica CBS 223.65]KDO33850.1 hypothetical protein SPRG_01729 [Saprolegnia parasitica CBS 223.65]|eukprot:XP_012195486.1 hypothetical protein SPRG_01729 [Saprolegnia parasitica CBS 223.65]